MSKKTDMITRRDFVKGASCAALGMAIGLPVLAQEIVPESAKSRVVLVRDKNAVASNGKINGEVIQRMLDQAVTALFDRKDPVDCWKALIKPDDIVGIKSNEWHYLPTTTQVEQAIKKRVMDAGVSEKNMGIDDRGVLRNPIFQKATALINARPMRTHAWSGVGSLIKNYVMFDPNPPAYHDNACAPLGKLWGLPIVKGKTRLWGHTISTKPTPGCTEGWRSAPIRWPWTASDSVCSRPSAKSILGRTNRSNLPRTI